MFSTRQGDLFQQDKQDDLFEHRPTPVYRADPDQVREELHRILAQAGGAYDAMGFSARRALPRDLYADEQLAARGRRRAVAVRF